MDKKILVESYIAEGQALISNLDNAGFPVYGAMWIFDVESGIWKLIIVTPRVDVIGPLETYRQISELMESLHEVLLKDIVATSPNNRFVMLLKSAISTERDANVGIRFTGNTINNFFVPDAYIYRLS